MNEPLLRCPFCAAEFEGDTLECFYCGARGPAKDACGRTPREAWTRVSDIVAEHEERGSK